MSYLPNILTKFIKSFDRVRFLNNTNIINRFRKYSSQSIRPEHDKNKESQEIPITILLGNNYAIPTPSDRKAPCDCQNISDCNCRAIRLFNEIEQVLLLNDLDDGSDSDYDDKVFYPKHRFGQYHYCSEKNNNLPVCIIGGICNCIKP